VITYTEAVAVKVEKAETKNRPWHSRRPDRLHGFPGPMSKGADLRSAPLFLIPYSLQSIVSNTIPG